MRFVDSHGMTYFPDDYIWNVPIDTMPVHPKSATKIANVIAASLSKCNNSAWCKGYEGNIWVSGVVPINWVDKTYPHYPITYALNGPPGGNSDWINPPLHAGLKVQAESGNDDNHCIIIDTDEKKAYEFFRMEGSGTAWSCEAEFVWDLNGYRILTDDKLHPPVGLASTNAAGVPYISGLARYDEIVHGEVDHAIGGITVRLNNLITWPGSSRIEANNSGYPATEDFPVYSDRLRLKAGVDISWMTPAAQVVARALKKYGIITMDRGSIGYSITVEKDSRMPALSDLHKLSLNDFEYVDESSLKISNLTAQAKVRITMKCAPIIVKNSLATLDFTVSSPAECYVGETVTVTVVCTNTSPFPGTANLMFSVSGTGTPNPSTKTLTVPANGSATTTFTYIPTAASTTQKGCAELVVT